MSPDVCSSGKSDKRSIDHAVTGLVIFVTGAHELSSLNDCYYLCCFGEAFAHVGAMATH